MSNQAQSPGKPPHIAIGRVVSAKSKKTVTVLVDRQVTHPVYGKHLRRSTKLRAHDENGECAVGDLVSIQECRRLSATKNWRLVQVLEKAPAPVSEIEA